MNPWGIRRKKPYTELGISRKKCIRCGNPAIYQWQICADGNNYRPLCDDCDVGMNELVLRYMKHPEANNITNIYRKRL